MNHYVLWALQILFNRSLTILVILQAYTLELEAEVAKLKDVIEDLQDKQVCV